MAYGIFIWSFISTICKQSISYLLNKITRNNVSLVSYVAHALQLKLNVWDEICIQRRNVIEKKKIY